MKYKFKQSLIVIYFFTGFLLLQATLFLSNYLDVFDGNTVSYDIFNVLITFLMVGMTTVLIIFKIKEEILAQGKKFLISLKKNLLFVIGFFILIFLIEIIGLNIISYYGLFNQVAVETENHAVIIYVFQFITLIIFTPIMEEIVFRKTLVSMIASKTHVIVSICMVNSFFAIMHSIGLNFSFFILYLCIGLMLSLAYKVSHQNIIVVILIHALLNIASILV